MGFGIGGRFSPRQGILGFGLAGTGLTGGVVEYLGPV